MLFVHGFPESWYSWRHQLPASRTDPDVFRSFFRSFNMLDAPDALLRDPVVLEAAAAAHATKDERPPAPTLGPPHDELLAVMAAAGRASS